MKSQLQVQVFRPTPLFTRLSSCVSYIWRNNGVSGLSLGFGATVLRNIPSVSLYFGVYEYARTHMAPTGGSVKDLTVSQLLTAGGLGGICYWGFTYPLDVIKSSIQGDNLDPSQRRYRGVLDCARKLYADGGAKRFYRGFTPCMMRAVPGNCVLNDVLPEPALNCGHLVASQPTPLASSVTRR